MNDKEQQRRERAYKIWEDEGRAEGSHEDHWQRAADQHELIEQESEDVIEVNQDADDPVPAGKGKQTPSAASKT